MLRKLGYVIVVLCAAIASTGIALSVGPTVRGVEFDTLVADVGSAREGQQARATFRFRNRASSKASIVGVVPACGVITSLVRGRTLARGERGEIAVRIDTVGRQGPLTGVVAVKLKDPFERTVVLTIKTIVDQEFVVDSPIVHFGNIAREVPARRQVNIRLNRTDHRVLSAGVKGNVSNPRRIRSVHHRTHERTTLTWYQ